MNDVVHRIGRRTLVPALALALAIGAAGMATSAAHAEPNSGGSTTVKCTYNGADYSVGAKVTVGYNKNGTPILQQCQKDGTWKRELPPVTRYPVVPVGVVAVAQ